jgi:LysM repeat protein
MLNVLKFWDKNRRIGWGQAALILLLFSLLAFDSQSNENSTEPGLAGVWGTKPILSHYLTKPKVLREFDQDLGYSKDDIQMISQIALRESERLEALESESIQIIQDRRLSVNEIRAKLTEIGYNQRLFEVLHDSEADLKKRLYPDTLDRLVDWIERKWRSDQQSQLQRMSGFRINLFSSTLFQKSYPRSYEVYATRYDAGGAYYVALPDKCLKFANGGAMRCSAGYEYGRNYSVAVNYKGKIVYATVGEAGPWNVDDNYWSTLSDPQPRRMFADLPLGIPAAQAAYFNGYNGGLDQFGRVVTSPVAIDISYAVAEDLGLPSGNNKVTVSYLWTEGWDNGQNQGGESLETAEVSVNPFIISTPNPDGSIIHVVEQGQTLIGIANSYNVELNDILALNGLGMETVLLPGDTVIVRTADPITPSALNNGKETQTPLPTEGKTSKLQVTDTASPVLGTVQITNTVAEKTGQNSGPGIDPILVGILLIALFGATLFFWGISSNRKK